MHIKVGGIDGGISKGQKYHIFALIQLVCDDSGVVIIEKDNLTEKFYQKLEAIEEQEDIWFDCIDRRKWDTFDTVCLKKYRDEK